MQFSTSTTQILVFLSLMAHCILADHLGFSQPTPQGENLPSPQLIVPNDSLAENPGKASLSQHLRAESEKSNNKRSASEGLSIEEPDWSLVAGNGDINCNSRSQNPADQYFPQSRFARSLSRLFKRQNNNDLCTFPESQNLQGETKNQAPVRQPENQKKPARVIPPSGETIRNMDADRLLMLIITQPHSQGNPNPEKCKHNLAYQVPICSPKTPGQPQLTQFSPQVEVVVPSRFWIEADPCVDDYEDFWCCLSALSLNLGSMRYPAAGFQCKIFPAL